MPNIRDVNGHAFSIMGAAVAILDDESKFHLIKIFNPHHEDTFVNNTFADNSSIWDRVTNLDDFHLEKTEEDGVYWVPIDDVINNYDGICIAKVKAHYEAQYKDIALKEGTNTYSTSFRLSNVKEKTVYVNVETLPERISMSEKECEVPYIPVNDEYTVTTPSGKTLKGKYEKSENGTKIISVTGPLKIKDPEDGLYEIILDIEKIAAYAYTFTINTYAPSGTLEFTNDDSLNENS